ncbi:glyoxalase/bleomycin resistance/extradiol dioxygenase family protein [Aquicoccus sp. SCR17]|nr:glyoxalase/bleomycin resistance/extradiol dioxygenase family protein [Carideicomes alvinocaridis]
MPQEPRQDDLPAAAPPGAMLETALYAEDLDAAERFYAGLLGLEVIVRVPGRHVFFRVGPGVLLLFNPEETQKPSGNPDFPVPPHGARGPGHACFAATLPEMEALRERLVAAGVEIESDFHWPNGARSIYFRDPAGNSLEIAEPGLWARDG